MTITNQAKDRVTKWMRWIARVIGWLATGYWLLIGILVIAMDEVGTWTWESTLITGFTLLGALAMLVAWWREGVGGLIAVVCGLGFSTFAFVTAGRNNLLAALVTGAPFLVAGALFLVCWWRTRELPSGQHGN